MYTTAPPKPPRPAAASSSTSSPAGGIRHEDVAPQALKPASSASASVPTAMLAATAYCYAKAMEDKHTFAPRLVLAAVRAIPSVVLMLTTLSSASGGNRTYARSIQWGLLLCAAGDAVIELDPLVGSVPIGGGGDRSVRLLSCGLALFMLAHAAYARAFVSDMPSPVRVIGACVKDGIMGGFIFLVPNLIQQPSPHAPAGPEGCGPGLCVLGYRVLEFAFIVPVLAPKLLGLDGKRLRMLAYTLSTSLLLVLALARCFAPKSRAAGVYSSQLWAAVGCVCFLFSDTLLSYTRHVRSFPFSEGTFLAFYFLGQAAITMSVPAPGRPTQTERAPEGEEAKEEGTQMGPAARMQRARMSKKVE